MMAEPGTIPEETCVRNLLRHRLPLQSQRKFRVSTQTLQSLLLWHTQWERMWGDTKYVQEQGELPISLWLAQPCLSAGHWWHTHGWDMPDLTAPRTCLSSGCLQMPLQCQALLWDPICGVKDWLPVVTQAPHYLYGCSAPAALLATAHNVPLRSNCPSTLWCFKGARLFCLKWWGTPGPSSGYHSFQTFNSFHI